MFGKKKKATDQDSPELTETLSEQEQAAELLAATEETEAEKAQRKFEREERKFLKEQQKKSLSRQRLVAPILLIVTIFISFLIWQLSR